MMQPSQICPPIADPVPYRHTGRRVLAALLVGALALCGAGCGSGDSADSGGQRQRQPPAVEAVQARSGALPLEEVLSGFVRARNQVAIRPEFEAPIEEVLVRSGETVERGQPLVRLDDDELRERLRQAEANLRLAQASAAEARARVTEIEVQVTRTRALTAERLVSQLDLETQEARLDAARAQADQAEARVEQVRASVEERRAALARAVVRAPIAGRIGQRNAEPGMLADTARTLFLIGDFDELIVEVPLTERLLSQVADGTPVLISARSLGDQTLPAAISRISPFLEQDSFSTVGEIDIDNREGRLRPGMFVSVRVLYGQSERATLVPTTALWENPETGLWGVFRIEEVDGLSEPAAPPAPQSEVPPRPRRVSFVPVELRAEGRGLAGVSGVEASEWVVTVGQQLLHEELRASDGAPIAARVRPTSWQQVLRLQGLQKEDLLLGFLDRQRSVAQAFGASIPEDSAAVDKLLTGDRGGQPASGR